MPAKRYGRCSLLPTLSEPSDKTTQLVNASICSDVENSDEDISLLGSERRRVKRSEQDTLYKTRRGKRRQRRTLLCTLLMLLVLYFYWKVNDIVPTPNGVALSEWPINTSRNASDYVLPENFTTLLEPLGICRNDIFLLIIVCSNIDNIAARQNIRNTWGNTTEFNYYKFRQIHADFQGKYLEPSLERLEHYRDYIIGKNLNSNSRQQLNITAIPSIIPVRVAFFIGRRKHESFAYKEALRLLHSESKKYDDIIQENFIDNYINFTVKSVMMLKWMTSRCLGSCAFIMKCNDDVFVNVPNLLHYLLGGTIPLYNETLHMYNKIGSNEMLTESNRLNKTRKLLVVHLFKNEQPFSDVTTKSYMPFYINGTKLSYLSGASYLMSSDVVPDLYVSALRTPLIYLEDIFITDICAKRIGLRPVHNPLFGLRSESPCIFKSSITQHRINSDALLNFYELVNDVSIKCALADELANNTLPHELHNKTKSHRNGYRKKKKITLIM